jgi:release factor glutamine methyltransferase
VRASWLTAFQRDSFDVVVANPPYVASVAIASLAPEVRDFEPRTALDGGPDGLDAIRELLAAGASVLRPGGHLMMELGAGQAQPARMLAARAGWPAAEVRADASGIERVLVARRGAGETGTG